MIEFTKKNNSIIVSNESDSHVFHVPPGVYGSLQDVADALNKHNDPSPKARVKNETIVFDYNVLVKLFAYTIKWFRESKSENI